jgi:predicted transcriptional regulator
VYDAIGQFPDGLTSKQIADFLGKSASQVSGLASKLFYYGKVDREFAPGYRGIYRYKPKKEGADSKAMD